MNTTNHAPYFDPHRFLSVQQVAELTHTCPQTVRRWIKSGRIRATSIGLRLLIEREELERIVSESAV